MLTIFLICFLYFDFATVYFTNSFRILDSVYIYLAYLDITNTWLVQFMQKSPMVICIVKLVFDNIYCKNIFM